MRTLITLSLLLALGCRNKDETTTPIDTGPLVDTNAPADSDGDGVLDDEDCAPGDPDVYPGATEIPYNGVNDDCDESTPDDDLDGDGYGEAEDCDESDPNTHDGATELCDGVDNDCDGEVDDAVGDVWYVDGDGDGFGDPEQAVQSCDGDEALVVDNTDCDDDDSDVNPGATEVCSPAGAPAEDDDCDGLIDAEDDSVADAETYWLDLDGDGYGDERYPATECDAPEGYVDDDTDCNDAFDDIHPGAAEVCDGEDNDCDGSADNDALDADTWYADADGDGFGDAASTTESCEQPSGYSAVDTDCDDADASANPAGTEVCDGADNDCDGDFDEDDAADASAWYSDSDNDGFGDPTSGESGCFQPLGTTDDDTDCDDADSDINPDADEVCDLADNDCDGDVDEATSTDAATWYADTDGDGYGGATTQDACYQPDGYVSANDDCDDADAAVSPEAEEVCDGVDNDCDGTADGEDASDAATCYTDDDGDGYGGAIFYTGCELPSACVSSDSGSAGEDCDDADADTNPAADEVCDDADNDCDSAVDEDAIDATTWYADADSDTWGDDDETAESCEPEAGYVSGGGDCDDADATANPDAGETCDEADDDCDGDIDEGVLADWYLDYDGDGYGDDGYSAQGCEAPSSLYVADGGDCDDADADFNPGETGWCDDQDHDCDGAVESDADGDDYSDIACGGTDCDDTDAAVLPEVDGGCAIGTSCQDILDQGKSEGDGVYTIDPDGFETGLDPADVYCDMSTDGGGWTMVQRTVWDWSDSRQLDTDYADWYGATVGAAESGSAFRLAGAYWSDLSVTQEHLMLHEMRDSADDGTSCEPLYYIGVDGLLTIDSAGATLEGLDADVNMINSETLSTTDVGDSTLCVTYYDGVPWFYSYCCSNCPTFKGGYWDDEAHPMNNYTYAVSDFNGNINGDVCPSGSALLSNAGSYYGGNATEYYLR